MKYLIALLLCAVPVCGHAATDVLTTPIFQYDKTTGAVSVFDAGNTYVPFGTLNSTAHSWTATIGANSISSSYLANGASAINLPTGVVPLVQDNSSSRVEIQKTNSPLNYAGTRAGFVYQQDDAQSGTANALIPSMVFQMGSTGDGVVTAPSHFSSTIWEGIQGSFTKSGNGSGQVFTAIGNLGAVTGTSSTGYNELGLFVGTNTNTGSVNGDLSGVEVLTRDGTSATNFPTLVHSVIGRTARYNGGGASSNFYASQEGPLPGDSILNINPQSSASWNYGLDLYAPGLGGFISGEAVRLPNNNSIASRNAAGTADVSVFFLDGANNLEIGYGGTPAIFGGPVRLQVTTVAGLGGCIAGLKGTMLAVSDLSAAPTYRQTGLTGGGTVYGHVECNGAAWEAH